MFQAAKLDIQRKEFEYMEKNAERNAERTLILNAYQTAKDMLDNYGEYMNAEEKRSWFKILNEKAILITGANGLTKSTYYTPSPGIRADSSIHDSNHTSSISTSSHPGRVSSMTNPGPSQAKSFNSSAVIAPHLARSTATISNDILPRPTTRVTFTNSPAVDASLSSGVSTINSLDDLLERANATESNAVVARPPPRGALMKSSNILPRPPGKPKGILNSTVLAQPSSQVLSTNSTVQAPPSLQVDTTEGDVVVARPPPRGTLMKSSNILPRPPGKPKGIMNSTVLAQPSSQVLSTNSTVLAPTISVDAIDNSNVRQAPPTLRGISTKTFHLGSLNNRPTPLTNVVLTASSSSSSSSTLIAPPNGTVKGSVTRGKTLKRSLDEITK